MTGYGAAMDACARAGRWEEALSLLQAMDLEQLTPNLVVCNAALRALSGRPEASELWAKMGSWGLRPDVRSLTAYGEADGQVEADNVLYASKLKALDAAGEWRQALELLLRTLGGCILMAN